ncbi:hypothetical protein B9G39_05915 [Zooshikella ganghwensis]|uniref:Uncharacterized protein n=1 Tax=Zooshikella ganghwensis TaxID=202772 RepID=A0A4P9VSM3_9GAMM|nr:hypothetical protein B9G39_05915 [Zooshikella ganghwensis]
MLRTPLKLLSFYKSVKHSKQIIITINCTSQLFQYTLITIKNSLSQKQHSIWSNFYENQNKFNFWHYYFFFNYFSSNL